MYENIRDFVIACDSNVPVYSVTETREVLHLVVACGSLHVLWEDIAEIRAVAIHPDYQHLGLGSKLVEVMKEEAKQLGIRHLYTFTLAENFFKTLSSPAPNCEPAVIWPQVERPPAVLLIFCVPPDFTVPLLVSRST